MTHDHVARFWDSYIEKIRAYKVPEQAKRWYVIRVEAYIEHYADLRLAQHTSAEVTKYLQELGRKPDMADWQFCQVVDALRILFCDLLDARWASSFPWGDWMDAAKALPENHASIARDIHPVPQIIVNRLGWGKALALAISPFQLETCYSAPHLKHGTLRSVPLRGLSFRLVLEFFNRLPLDRFGRIARAGGKHTFKVTL